MDVNPLNFPRASGSGARLAHADLFIRFAAGSLWLAVLTVLGVLGISAYRGLEGTDEASYLLTAANPWASPGNGIFSGFLLHPLWLVSGDVGSFRLVGYLLLFVASLVFSAFFIQVGPHLGAGETFRRYRMLLVPSLALAVLTRYSVGIRTPGYDWAILFFSLLLAACWLRLESRGQGPISLLWLAVFTSLGLGIILAKWMVFPGYFVLFSFLLIKSEVRLMSFFLLSSWVNLASYT